MYRYRIKPGIVSHAKYYWPGCRWPDSAWFYANIKPHIKDYCHWHDNAFRDIHLFTFYSKTRLELIPMNGYLFPVKLFLEETC